MKSRNIRNRSWYRKLPFDKKKQFHKAYHDLFDYQKLIPSIPDILANQRVPSTIARSLIRKIEKLNRMTNVVDFTFVKREQYEELAEEIITSYKQYNFVPVVRENIHDRLYKRINSSLYPDHVKEILREKVEIISCESNADKYYQWLNIILTIPQSPLLLNSRFLSISEMTFSVMNSLNRNIYGMTAVKEELICTLASMFVNPQTKGKSLGLCGPPGTGKTAIVRSLSSGIGLPFFQINVGNLADSLSLDGHGFTYTKSECGLIVKALREMKFNNGIIYFDEVDKLSESNKGMDVISSLIHITDFTQNSNYQDNYVGEISIDLSNIFFVFSFNDKDRVNKTLLSRIPVINVSKYNDTEKKHILLNYLLPEVCQNYNINHEEIKFSEEAISLILSYHQSYDGVREIREFLEMLIKRLSLYFHVNDVDKLNMSFKVNNFSRPFTVSEEIVTCLINNISQAHWMQKEKLYSLYI